MIFITQLIFVKSGAEKTFQKFEEFAIPLMEKYNGKIIYRLRPTEESYISGDKDRPYEIHFISFDSEEDLNNFLSDDTRLSFLHLKEQSVRSTLLIKGHKM
ncbi:DUF1330 domain-containing protein [Reichenbachiella sp. MALMAid0571]|uniref:DUF1330 domain-containing protein n=1 Tax=Reichenbachiella sp. MALMAid0571 TaxID=3143939 RepID=UPI0032DEAFF6